MALALFVACGDDSDDADPTEPTGSVTETASGGPGVEITFVGDFSDDQGISTITIVNSDLGLDITLDGGDETRYFLSQPFTISADQTDGDYVVTITVTNVKDLTAEFSVTVTVACDLNGTFTTEHNSTWEYYDEWTDTLYDIVVTVEGDQLTLDGDVIWWWPVVVTATMVEDPANPGTGTLDWGDDPILLTCTTGCNDGDGYYGGYTDGYMVVTADNDESTYDACSGVITLSFDFMFNDGVGNGSDNLTYDATVWAIITKK